MNTYTVRAEWSNGHWVLEVPEIPGVTSQVQWLVQAEPTMRTAIATELAVAAQSVGIEVVPVLGLGAEVDALVEEAGRARDELASMQRQVSAATQQALNALTSEGFAVQDAAQILGIKVAHGAGDGALGAA
jgi:DNA-directed RNA polymerase specialized sigma24 family protein